MKSHNYSYLQYWPINSELLLTIQNFSTCSFLVIPSKKEKKNIGRLAKLTGNEAFKKKLQLYFNGINVSNYYNKKHYITTEWFGGASSQAGTTTEAISHKWIMFPAILGRDREVVARVHCVGQRLTGTFLENHENINYVWSCTWQTIILEISV